MGMFDLLKKKDPTVQGNVDKPSSVVFSEQIFDVYRGAQREKWIEQVREDIDFYNSAQWKDKDAKDLHRENKPALSLNEILPGINQLIAQLTANDPRWMAIGREDSDWQMAKNITLLASYIWQESNGNAIVRQNVKDYEVTGMCAQMVFFDPTADKGRGEIRIADIDPLDLFIDPNAKRRDCQDAAHIIISKVFTGERIQESYPGFDFQGAMEEQGDNIPGSNRNFNLAQNLTKTDDTYHKKYRIIDRYSKVKERIFHVYDEYSDFERLLTKKEYEEFLKRRVVAATKREGTVYLTRDDDVEEMVNLYKAMGGSKNLQSKVTYHIRRIITPDGQEAFENVEGVETGDPQAVPGSTTMLEVLNMRQLVKQNAVVVNEIINIRVQRVLSIGGKLYYEDTLPISLYPIPITQLHYNRNPYPISDVRLTKPLQEQLNKNESQITTYMTNITSLQVFIPTGSITNKADFEKKLGKAGVQYHEYLAENGGPGVVVVQYPPLASGAYQRSADLRSTIQRILGAYAFQDGVIGNAPQTFKGTSYIDQMGQRRSRLKRKDIEDMINITARIISEYIPYVYTERKIVRLILPNNPSREVIFNERQGKNRINDLSNANYDIQIVTGSMLAVDSEMELDRLLNAWDRGILRDNAVILRKMNLDNLDEILERNDIIPQLQQQVMSLQQEVKRLQGDMQTKDRELVTADRQVLKSKFDAELKKAGSEVNARVELAKQRMSDIEKSKKKEAVE